MDNFGGRTLVGVAGLVALCLSFFLRGAALADEEEESDADVPEELKEFNGSSDLETERDWDLLYLLRSFLGMIFVSFMVYEQIQNGLGRISKVRMNVK